MVFVITVNDGVMTLGKLTTTADPLTREPTMRQ